MPATVTLGTTTLVSPAGQGDAQITVASTSGLFIGTLLFVDRELMAVSGFGVGTQVNVRRGVDGTMATPHASGSTLYIGRADQFYDVTPEGIPPAVIPVSPYINVRTGVVWFALGDTTPSATGTQFRFWQPQTVTYDVGALGVRTATLTPTAST